MKENKLGIMSDTFKDYLAAILIGIALALLALDYFDVLVA